MEFRRGLAAIEEAKNKSATGGSFKAFCPEIRWREDKEDKYVLFITDVQEYAATVDLHEWIPVGEQERADGSRYTKYESFISRKDLGEATDELSDRLDNFPRRRTLGVALELEPIMEMVKGRQRPRGFTVKTTTFTRDDVDQESPVIGVVTQSPRNFWGWLGSFDETTAPITDTPLQVIRRGKDASTEYDFIPYQDTEVDLSPLLENLGNIGYLNDKQEEMLAAVEGADNDNEAAIQVGNLLLDKRLEELADKDRYDELVGPIQEIKSPFPKRERKPAKVQATRPTTDSSKAEKFAALRAEVEANA